MIYLILHCMLWREAWITEVVFVLSLAGVTDINTVYLLAFSWAPKSPQMVTADIELKDTCSLEEKLCQT